MRRLLETVERSGIVLRDIDRGLVDFPALLDGREVYLCWELGEDDVGYWHDLEARLRWPRAARLEGPGLPFAKLVRDLRGLGGNERIAVIGAAVMVGSLLLPWYQSPISNDLVLTGIGAFGWAEGGAAPDRRGHDLPRPAGRRRLRPAPPAPRVGPVRDRRGLGRADRRLPDVRPPASSRSPATTSPTTSTTRSSSPSPGR